MENKLVRSILAGVVATAVMTGVTFMALGVELEEHKGEGYKY